MSIMQIWDEAKSTKEELYQVRCKLEVMDLGHMNAELDRSMAEEA